jgi:hypothetical protein
MSDWSEAVERHRRMTDRAISLAAVGGFVLGTLAGWLLGPVAFLAGFVAEVVVVARMRRDRT